MFHLFEANIDSEVFGAIFAVEFLNIATLVMP